MDYFLLGAILMIFLAALPTVRDYISSGKTINLEKVKSFMKFLNITETLRGLISIRKARKERAIKMKEIDKKLEEVVAEGSEGNKDILTSVLDSGEYTEDSPELLDESIENEIKEGREDAETKEEHANIIETQEREKEENLIEELEKTDLDEDLKIELENESDFEEEIKEDFEFKEEKQENKEVKLEDEDELLEDLEKEIAKKKEEEIDLLRDLKNENLNVYEMEKELKEVLIRLRELAERSRAEGG